MNRLQKKRELQRMLRLISYIHFVLYFGWFDELDAIAHINSMGVVMIFAFVGVMVSSLMLGIVPLEEEE